MVALDFSYHHLVRVIHERLGNNFNQISHANAPSLIVHFKNNATLAVVSHRSSRRGAAARRMAECSRPQGEKNLKGGPSAEKPPFSGASAIGSLPRPVLSGYFFDYITLKPCARP